MFDKTLINLHQKDVLTFGWFLSCLDSCPKIRLFAYWVSSPVSLARAFGSSLYLYKLHHQGRLTLEYNKKWSYNVARKTKCRTAMNRLQSNALLVGHSSTTVWTKPRQSVWINYFRSIWTQWILPRPHAAWCRNRGSFPRRAKNFFSFAVSRSTRGPSRLPVKLIPWATSFPGVKWLVCEVHRFPPSKAEVKERVELYLHGFMHFHGVVF
jgi:hypothetical protein